MKNPAKRWLEFALKDKTMADAGYERGEYDLAAYHLQQLVEKSLKAIIIFHGIVVPLHRFKTHIIGDLLDILEENGIEVPSFVKKATSLTRYAFEVRYPDDYVPVSVEEYEEAYEIALNVCEWAKGIIEGSEGGKGI